jgi:hypothetical protein
MTDTTISIIKEIYITLRALNVPHPNFHAGTYASSEQHTEVKLILSY